MENKNTSDRPQSGPATEPARNDQDKLQEFMREQDKQTEDESAAEQQRKDALTERD